MPALEVRDLRVTFGGIHAVDGAGFDVPAGAIVGLIGPNGAGKTTVVNALSGLVESVGGHARWDGVDLLRLRPHERARRGIGRTFQALRLFAALSALDNVKVALHTHAERGLLSTLLGRRSWRAEERRLEEVALEALDFVGLASVRDRAASELSYGMLRLLELACMVALRPRMLLLDEPTSGVAKAEIEALAPLLVAIRRELDASLLIVEHDLELMSDICDRLVAMHLGEVLVAGRPADVLDDARVLECYVGGTPT